MLLFFDGVSGRVLEGFRNDFGTVLEDLLVAKRLPKGKTLICENHCFYLCHINVFRGCRLHFGCQKERTTEWESDPDSNSILL